MANVYSREGLVAAYRRIFQVSLGPLGRKVWSTSWASVWKTVFETLRYVGKTVRDGVLYRQTSVIDQELAPGKPVWIMVASKNNLDTLRFIHTARSDSQVVVFSKADRELGSYPRLNLAPQGLYWWKAMWLIPKLWPFFGIQLLLRFHTFLQGLGTLERAHDILRREKPRCLIFANDHTAFLRAFAEAAVNLDIATVYLQHASVSSYFPPLVYDLSMLEGKIALQIYRRCGPIRGEVALVGMPKFDPFVRYRNFSPSIKRVGVCSNLLDDRVQVEDLLRRLQRALPELRITYRPHPRNRRKLDLPPGIFLSDSRREGIFSFLSQQDLIIAGETSTHLESVLLNVVSLYYPMNDKLSDYYGYVAQGLVPQFDQVEELIAWIGAHRTERPTVFNKAKPYNALVGTPEESASQSLCLRHLEDLLEDRG